MITRSHPILWNANGRERTSLPSVDCTKARGHGWQSRRRATLQPVPLMLKDAAEDALWLNQTCPSLASVQPESRTRRGGPSWNAHDSLHAFLTLGQPLPPSSPRFFFGVPLSQGSPHHKWGFPDPISMEMCPQLKASYIAQIGLHYL